MDSEGESGNSVPLVRFHDNDDDDNFIVLDRHFLVSSYCILNSF